MEDNFYNEQGFEVSAFKAYLKSKGYDQDERFKAISAEEYQKHAENLGAKTTQLISRIAQIEKQL